MAAVTEQKGSIVQIPKFELTDLRIPFVDMAGKIYKPETVIVAFKTNEIMMEFYKNIKHTFADLVVFDRRDNETNSVGIRLRIEKTQTHTVNDILKRLNQELGEDQVSPFLKKYFN